MLSTQEMHHACVYHAYFSYATFFFGGVCEVSHFGIKEELWIYVEEVPDTRIICKDISEALMNRQMTWLCVLCCFERWKFETCLEFCFRCYTYMALKYIFSTYFLMLFVFSVGFFLTALKLVTSLINVMTLCQCMSSNSSMKNGK